MTATTVIDTIIRTGLAKHGTWAVAAAVLFFAGVRPVIDSQRDALKQQAESYKVLAASSTATVQVLQEIRAEQSKLRESNERELRLVRERLDSIGRPWVDLGSGTGTGNSSGNGNGNGAGNKAEAAN